MRPLMLASVLAFVMPSLASAQTPEVARPYREGVDSQVEIDAAVQRAAREDRRVLLMFGGNWCIWCRRLEWVLQNDRAVAASIARRWIVVHVDVGRPGSDVNRRVVARYGNPVEYGLPCLVVLDREGRVRHVQETESLERGERHDPARVLAFLERWQS